jgi:3-dehydroquinate synthase
MTTAAVRVDLRERGYDIAFASGDRAGIGTFARQRTPGAKALIVTDENVNQHARTVAESLTAARFAATTAVLPPGEDQKSLASAAVLYDRLVELQADRRTLIVAVGGGVIGDLAGFVGATYARGLPLLMVPTTLLAMVDSSVGGKVGVNHPKGKNLIGAFHQPIGVWIDSDFLKTLPEREYRSGLAEVVKYSVILDPELFDYLESHLTALLDRDGDTVRYVIGRCCRLKARIVEQDERETRGLRAVLNYGHTFAHAFETVSGYGEWLHGEAVAAGMICASRLAERRQLLTPDVTSRQEKLLSGLGLPIRPGRWPVNRLMEAMRLDKKAEKDRIRFILPHRLGEVVLHDDIPEDDLRAVLEELTSTGAEPR